MRPGQRIGTAGPIDCPPPIRTPDSVLAQTADDSARPDTHDARFILFPSSADPGLNQEFEVTIPSDTAQGQAVQERIVKMLEDLDFPTRDVFGVRLALEEALVNAIKHGNRMDPAKQVRIHWAINSESVRIEIEDEGTGFRPEDIPDPTAEENLEKPSGRGIMLMRAFMSEVGYNASGNRVTLVKRRDPSGAAAE